WIDGSFDAERSQRNRRAVDDDLGVGRTENGDGDPWQACGKSGDFLVGIVERPGPRAGRAWRDAVANDAVVAFLRFDELSEADLRASQTQEEGGRVNQRVGAAEFVDGD